MTQCTPTRELVDRIGDAISRRAVRLHDDLGLPRTAAARWAHDQRADERRASSRQLDRPAHDTETEIEVTPEMIEAGVKLLCDFYDTAPDWFTADRARDVYIAMRSLCGQKTGNAR